MVKLLGSNVTVRLVNGGSEFTMVGSTRIFSDGGNMIEGEVVSVGDGVTRAKVGDRVYLTPGDYSMISDNGQTVALTKEESILGIID